MGVASRALQRLGTEPRRPRWVRSRANASSYAVATVCIGAFMGQLDASIVTVALPSIQRDFGTSVGAVAWVGLGYLVALIAWVVAIGRVSDMHGRKLIYLYGFGTFVVGSGLCAVAPSLGVLIACRVLQGAGAAMLQANSVAFIALAVPRERLARSIGIQGAAQALGLAAGPTVGGLLLPAIGAGLCALTLAGAGGLGTRWTIALGLAAVGLAWAFVAHERRAAAPLVELALLRSRAIALGFLGTLASFAMLFGALLAVPFFLERGLHVGVVVGGVVLASMPAAMGVSAVLAGHASGRHGARRLVPQACS